VLPSYAKASNSCINLHYYQIIMILYVRAIISWVLLVWHTPRWLWRFGTLEKAMWGVPCFWIK
jgi:hypothetical protein